MTLSPTRTSPPPSAELAAAARVRWLFFLYVVLFVFEGALRKWVLPGLATPLLIVRDPVALAAVGLALYRGWFPLNGYVLAIGAAAVFSLAFTLTIGHGSLAVALFGARLWLLHVPAAFVFARVLRQRDVLAVGRVLLWAALPVALLAAAQFYSPQSAFVNRGVGGDLAGSGFDGALGYFRPSGLFSFTNGNAAFFTLCGAFSIAFWLRPHGTKLVPLLLGTAGVVLAVPVSLSRGYVFSVAVLLAFAFATLVTDRRAMGRAALAVVGIATVGFLLNQTGLVGTGLDALTARFSNAGDAEGSLGTTIGSRVFGEMFVAIASATQVPFWGVGLGLGTNAGAALLYGERIFLVDESEWGRIVGEMGGLLGGVVLLARVILAGSLALRGWRFAMRYKDPLPWMLVGAGAFVIVKGQLGLATDLGYFVILVALIIGASRPRPMYAAAVAVRR